MDWLVSSGSSFQRHVRRSLHHLKNSDRRAPKPPLSVNIEDLECLGVDLTNKEQQRTVRLLKQLPGGQFEISPRMSHWSSEAYTTSPHASLCYPVQAESNFTKLQSRLGHGAEHTVRHLPDPLAQNNIKPQQIVSWRYSSVHLPIGIFSVGQKAEADTQPHHASSRSKKSYAIQVGFFPVSWITSRVLQLSLEFTLLQGTRVRSSGFNIKQMLL